MPRKLTATQKRIRAKKYQTVSPYRRSHTNGGRCHLILPPEFILLHEQRIQAEAQRIASEMLALGLNRSK